MLNRLKVLFITSWYPDSTNPIHGIFVREHAKAVQIYDDVTVLHLTGYDKKIHPLWHLEQENDPDLTRGITTYRLHSRKLSLPGTSFIAHLLGVLATFRRLNLHTTRSILIHAHTYRAGLLSILLGNLYHLPVIITEHNSAFPRQLLRPSEILKARFAFENAQRVLPVSQALRKGIEQYHIRAKFTVIPNAVDFESFFFEPSKPANNPPKCLFVGSLIPVKGVYYLLQAIAQLKNLPWTLDLVGEGKERTNYQELSQSLGIDHRLAFHGYQSHEKVAEFMHQADLFILPSMWENMPCVLLEAQACGLPIVATNVGGIPEIVEPGSGWLVQPGDVVSLADTISQALDQIGLIDRQAIACRAQKYGKSEVGLALHKLYQEVLSQ
jgi:L-malate glycosyltransferase